MNRFLYFLLIIHAFTISCNTAKQTNTEVNVVNAKPNLPNINSTANQNNNNGSLFPSKLSFFKVYSTPLLNLKPNDGFIEYDLQSSLFTDYADKHRLIYLPNGYKALRGTDVQKVLEFPDGTLLFKTFYYRKESQFGGKRVIETRVLRRHLGEWYSAVYVWNNAQTDATLQENGFETHVTFTDKDGITRETDYQVPSQDQCIECHQKKGIMKPLGPSPINLNFNIATANGELNQLSHLMQQGILENFNVANTPSLPNYNDTNLSNEQRARAYLHSNCSHCHNPEGVCQEEPYDFRFLTSINQTGIFEDDDEDENEILENLEEGDMPLIGTTLIDQKGVRIIRDYLLSQ